jgi:hypothetical protein
MEGMRTTNNPTVHDDLDRLVPFNSEHTSLRQEIMRILRTTQDLEKHWNGRRDKTVVVDAEQESLFIKAEGEVECDIGTIWGWLSRSSSILA